jgi:hypothetical protein
MGRQVQFHGLSEDVKAFLEFVHERDPVIVTFRPPPVEIVPPE